MQLSHAVRAGSVRFDDPNLVSAGGLVPVARLADRAGLSTLARQWLSVPGGAGAAAGAKVTAIVLGMVAGADCIADLDVLRHGGMGRLFGGVRAPSTLGTFLRAFRFGHVRQLDAVAARLLAGLARQAPILPAGADGGVTWIDVDDTVGRTYGYAKQGAGFGYSGVKGLNALLAVVSTASSAPLIVATRLRRGSANSARGAARLVADAIVTVRNAGVTGMLVLRADSAYYGADVVAAARRRGVRFSITARKTPAVLAAIAAIPDCAWVPIRYPHAVFDDQLGQWVSDAQVAEVPFTAFTSRPRAQHVSARLIVRRVRAVNPGRVHGSVARAAAARAAAGGQGELFTAFRHHAVFTDNPAPLLDAEADHRRHAIVEQVIADLKNGPLAHLPSGVFTANAAWLVLAAIAFNLTRTAGVLASSFHAKATTATVRRQLITIPARIAVTARVLVLHLPTGWPWQHGWQQLIDAATGPPLQT